jgi:hypothetical protein
MGKFLSAVVIIPSMLQLAAEYKKAPEHDRCWQWQRGS